jgi:hypothetical protein
MSGHRKHPMDPSRDGEYEALGEVIEGQQAEVAERQKAKRGGSECGACRGPMSIDDASRVKKKLASDLLSAKISGLEEALLILTPDETTRGSADARNRVKARIATLRALQKLA